MNPQIFSVSGKDILYNAKQIAITNCHERLTIIHIALAIFRSKDFQLTEIFQKLKVDLDSLRACLRQELSSIPQKNILQKIIYSTRTEKLVNLAIQKRDADKHVSAKHFLLAVCELAENGLKELLTKNNLQAETITELLKEKQPSRITDSFKNGSKEEKSNSSENKTTPKKENFIQDYCIDLVKKVDQGKMDPVIGRDEELRNLIQVLLRRRKNNPMLIGEPGVGKTALVEALAKRIYEGDVPEHLQDVQLLELDLSKMLAGSRYRGDFEKRIKGVIEEIVSLKKGAVLFIDELHTLVGAGSTEGGLDASNMFKPALARGELHCIGATTLKEYKKKIEPDSALTRRFQTIVIKEPDKQNCVGILRGLKEKYELHHGVRIQDAAIVAASELSDRYVNHRFLPDKAIDLIDEAASKMRMEIDSMPIEIDLLDRKILQLEIEKTALKKEKDDASKKRLQEIENEISTGQEKRDTSKKQWLEEKNVIEKNRKIKEEIEKKKKEELDAQRQGNLELAAEIRYGDLTQLHKEQQEINQKIDNFGEKRFLKEEVGREEVCAVLSKWTGIPLEKMLLSEKEKLLSLEQHLQKRVVGQETAINAVSNSVRRARTYIDDPRKPSGSFFFFGPTGVGKTELVKALADILFKDEQVIIRLDMSEYMEKHTISRLIGAPPGYVGYGEGGLLTEAVHRNPYSIVLFDEIEKGHPEVFNILLQILDEGTLTDSKGLKVSFKNTLVILTSNFGSHIFFEENKRLTPAIAREILLQKFKPELLNRVDEIIPFYPLRKDDILEIIGIHFQNVQKNLRNQNIEVSITQETLHYLVEIGFDKEFGARPLRRIVQKELLDIIAYKIVDGTIQENDKIEVRYANKHLTLHRVR